jgi:branched-subunit amino acid ABC-type transport system permease component
VEELISSIIRGFPVGCVYALVAVGFVLTYKTSGVFNLAFGAQAYISAALYYKLRVQWEWPIPWAVLVSVVLLAPLLGLLLDRALYRHLRTAPHIAKLVTSLGLLVALPEITNLLLELGTSTYGTQGIVNDGRVTYAFGSYVLNRNDLATIVVVFAAVGLLTALFKFTALGLRMRAVVESARLTELAGVNADRVGSGAWMLSSLFAGLAGVLLAPLFPYMSAVNYFGLVVSAIAAAVLASLSSLPIALAGGIGLGVLGQVLYTYLPQGSIIRQELGPSLPFVVLFVLLVCLPGLQRRREVTDPLAGADPPPPAFAADERSPALTRATYVFGALVGAVFLWWILFSADAYWLGRWTEAAVYAVIFLSITVITGMAGQVSLCQATFAGIGALTTAQLVDRFDMSVLAAMVIGAGVAAAVGALVSIPALRLGGIFLALATLAFALFFERVMLKFEWVGGPPTPMRVPRPTIGPWDFTDDRAFFLLVVAILAIVGTIVLFVRSGTVGRYLDALRGSEVAASSVGINPARARITAFAFSAAIAGLGGALLAIHQGRAGAANYDAAFQVTWGLVWVVIVVSLGSRTVEGAIQAGFGLVVFPVLVLERILHLSPSWSLVLFGLGALAYARHPEGTLEHGKRMSLNRIQRWLDRRAGKRQPDVPTGVGAVLPDAAHEERALDATPVGVTDTGGER